MKYFSALLVSEESKYTRKKKKKTWWGKMHETETKRILVVRKLEVFDQLNRKTRSIWRKQKELTVSTLRLREWVGKFCRWENSLERFVNFFFFSEKKIYIYSMYWWVGEKNRKRKSLKFSPVLYRWCYVS